MWTTHSVGLLPGLPVCCAEAGGSPEKNSQWSLFHKMKLFASQLPLGPPRCYQIFFFLPHSPTSPPFFLFSEPNRSPSTMDGV